MRAEKWVQNGFCLAHREGGGPVFVHGALPGETVRVEIVKTRSTHSFARVLEVLEAAPDRRPDDCSAFPACGGCSFRHLDYASEVALKLELLGEWKRLATLRELPGFRIVTGEPDGYRRNVRVQNDGKARGFFGLHSNRLVPLPEEGCRQASPNINAELRALRPDEGSGREVVLRDAADDEDWQTPPASFAQSNRFLIRPWLETMRDWLADGIDTLELFCGSGLIGGFARERIGEYRGVDADRDALQAARANFERRGFRGQFVRADLYNRPPAFTAQRIIANPPRAGLGRALIQACAEPAPAREILYSSCNPHTLDRDLGELDRLGFRPRRALAFDFFPRTPHLEILVQLERD